MDRPSYFLHRPFSSADNHNVIDFVNDTLHFNSYVPYLRFIYPDFIHLSINLLFVIIYT